VDFELVLIDKTVSKERFRHLDKAVHPSERYPNGRISLADLLELQKWLKLDTYGPKQQKWKELAPDQTAVGIDLGEIRTKLQAGLVKKPKTP
jgi:hypothetical protein